MIHRRSFFSTVAAAIVGSRVKSATPAHPTLQPNQPGTVEIAMRLTGKDIAELLTEEVQRGGRAREQMRRLLRGLEPIE